MSVQLRAAGIILYRRTVDQIEYLLLKASYGSFHWSPPKGHVDPGESAYETAVRETREEVGLTDDQFTVLSHRSQTTYIVKGKPKLVEYWLAELNNPDTPITLSEEHTDYSWLPLQPAKDLNGFEEMNRILDECDNFIQKHQKCS